MPPSPPAPAPPTQEPPGTTVLHPSTPATPAITLTLYKHPSPINTLLNTYMPSLHFFQPPSTSTAMPKSTLDDALPADAAHGFPTADAGPGSSRTWKVAVPDTGSALAALAGPDFCVGEGQGGDADDALKQLKAELDMHFQGLRSEFEERTGRVWGPLRGWGGEAWEWDGSESDGGEEGF